MNNSEIFTQYDAFLTNSRNLRPNGVNEIEYCGGLGGNKATASDRAENDCKSEAAAGNCKQVGDTDCACALGDFVCFCTTTWKCP